MWGGKNPKPTSAHKDPLTSENCRSSCRSLPCTLPLEEVSRLLVEFGSASPAQQGKVFPSRCRGPHEIKQPRPVSFKTERSITNTPRTSAFSELGREKLVWLSLLSPLLILARFQTELWNGLVRQLGVCLTVCFVLIYLCPFVRAESVQERVSWCFPVECGAPFSCCDANF